MIANLWILLLSVLVSVTFSLSSKGSAGQSPFSNHNQLMRDGGFSDFFQTALAPRKKVKIAIIDNGFRGFEAALGVDLASDTHTDFARGPLAPPTPEEEHGLVMAKIVYDLMTDAGRELDFAPEIYLLNSFGYTNFTNAVTQSIENHVDLILYAQVWEYGGNNDTKGFINAQVNRALDAGILWMNAAGDFGKTTYNSGIASGQDDWIRLPSPNSSVKVTCRPRSGSTCHLRSVLAWNDFKDDPTIGTDKDLDFFLFDDTLNLISSSQLHQMPNPPEGQLGNSKYPREILNTDISTGVYYLKAKDRSHNFSGHDRLRITVSGAQDGSLTLDPYDKAESLLTPADNPGVITVSGKEPENSSSQIYNKPDLISLSEVKLPGNTGSLGASSPAVAIATAGAALTLGQKSGLNRDDLLSWISFRNQERLGLFLRDLMFYPRSGGACFESIDRRNFPPFTYEIFNSYEGMGVATNYGAKIFVPYDPITLVQGMRRVQYNDIIALTPRGYYLFPRNQMGGLPGDAIEIVQDPQDGPICNFARSGGSSAPSFKMWHR